MQLLLKALEGYPEGACVPWGFQYWRMRRGWHEWPRPDAVGKVMPFAQSNMVVYFQWILSNCRYQIEESILYNSGYILSTNIQINTSNESSNFHRCFAILWHCDSAVSVRVIVYEMWWHWHIFHIYKYLQKSYGCIISITLAHIHLHAYLQVLLEIIETKFVIC